MALDFSRNYSPPGVYIEESDSTLVSTTGVPPTIVAIVGPAQGYQNNTEQARVTPSGTVTLAKEGINRTAGFSVTEVGTGAEVPATDYSLAASSSDPDLTVVTFVADPATADNTDVFIAYQYTPEDYYSPRRFENFEDVKDVYGEPLNLVAPDGSTSGYQYVTSPLSLAAATAIRNGATDLVLCATTPPAATDTTAAAKSTARRTALNAAYAKIATDNLVNVIVPITHEILAADAPTALADLRTAVVSAANDGFYRFGIIGFSAEVDTAPDVLIANVTDRRLMLAYAGPGGLQMWSGATNTSFAVGHSYLAAGYAGRMQALPVQQSLTKQVIAGFAGLAGTPLSNSLKNQYSAAGVAVTEQDRFSRLTVRHAVTTDVTNVNTRESSVVRAKDSLVTALSEGMTTSGLLGAPIDGDLLLSVKSAVQGILESAVGDEVIVEYTGLSLRQTDSDPSVVEVKFAYKPAYPLNYIVISFSIDMSTGVTDLNTDETLV